MDKSLRILLINMNSMLINQDILAYRHGPTNYFISISMNGPQCTYQ